MGVVMGDRGGPAGDLDAADVEAKGGFGGSGEPDEGSALAGGEVFGEMHPTRACFLAGRAGAGVRALSG
jgi:hypothetical protein